MSRNDALRAARLRKGWRTVEAAATAVTEHGQQLLDDCQFTVSARTWRRWEGDRPGWPAEETAIVIHDALGRWPEDLGFTTPPGWIRPEHHEEEQVRRQAFVPVTAAALVAGPVAPQHVDPALIDYFQQQLEGHYRADMFLGPHDLIGTVSAQYQLIDKLLRSAKGETRRGLLRVGAAYAALVGWLYQDAGDMDGAAFWRGVTQEIAMRSRDSHLIGYSLVNQAQVRTDLGDGHAVVDLCEAVLDDADQLVPKVRIMAMQQQAHGASLTGERGLVDQLIRPGRPAVAARGRRPSVGERMQANARIPGSAAGHLLRTTRPRCGGRRTLVATPRDRSGDCPPGPRGVHGPAGNSCGGCA
ncbi:Twin-arginine translocation pathway signal (plasmid) [Streptomyces sp. NBC_01591]|uniref:Twin-arginine translocation pathway signal n=1 Tax=Streptomyces sp. NBC_01591 TaxID=2975888 RepID=UPI002DDC5657|nr:Twin-arginine translocation pathway signal [Streptomyces sp. NBC_01591]WSD74810.1 Twin-arginine translocation pathway signal [Streptomyces sp. NBC_01591]